MDDERLLSSGFIAEDVPAIVEDGPTRRVDLELQNARVGVDLQEGRSRRPDAVAKLAATGPAPVVTPLVFVRES